MKTKIYYTIEKIAAIKAGKNQWGKFCVELDPAEVPEAARSELAPSIGRKKGKENGTRNVEHKSR
jgi:hypothetical protein